jgi:hypothetical protein
LRLHPDNSFSCAARSTAFRPATRIAFPSGGSAARLNVDARGLLAVPFDRACCAWLSPCRWDNDAAAESRYVDIIPNRGFEIGVHFMRSESRNLISPSPKIAMQMTATIGLCRDSHKPIRESSKSVRTPARKIPTILPVITTFSAP